MEEKQVSFYNKLLNSKAFLIMLPILGLVFGLIFFFLQIGNIPITRDKAETYSGYFERYETSKNYCEIIFSDGSEFDVYPHTEKEEFRNRMASLEKGTPLVLSVKADARSIFSLRKYLIRRISSLIFQSRSLIRVPDRHTLFPYLVESNKNARIKSIAL